MMKRLRLLLPTLWRLGPAALVNFAAYRISCRIGLYRRMLAVREWTDSTDFFDPPQATPPTLRKESRDSIIDLAAAMLPGNIEFYCWSQQEVGNPPDWFLDPLTGIRLNPIGHWSDIDEFASSDIKNVWEASRFQWAPRFSQAWRLTGDAQYVDTLNCWLADWAMRNSFNEGPNWKCGQETSIRLVNLMLTAYLLGTHVKPTTAFVHLIAIHCARISPTIRYAVAQNNNHGTSEAAALFIGGAWLARQDQVTTLGKKPRYWCLSGRQWLENRVKKLVADDGSFSQHSTNYHRVLVDTLCQVEFWRKQFKERAFSDDYSDRCRKAVEWIAALTDAETGDAPNLGANDGARLYDLSCLPYRDFRPSIQLGSVLFRGGRAYNGGSWDDALLWLELESSAEPMQVQRKSHIYGDGGYVILRGSRSWCTVRLARFRYRPSHADCLHLDLWHQGKNILRDGGTYSYNTQSQWVDYFSGTESHNTVQFDDRDQMPRIGRFLFGDWLKMEECGSIQEDSNGLRWTGAYTDGKQASHRRTVTVCKHLWKIVDELNGVQNHAVLRWRLIPESWYLSDNICESESARLQVVCTAPPHRLELSTGWESRCYQQKTELPVLEIEVGPGSSVIKTEIVLKT